MATILFRIPRAYLRLSGSSQLGLVFIGPKGLDRHHGATDEVALRCMFRFSCLLLLDRDAIGILELFFEVTSLLTAQQFLKELNAAGPVDGVQQDQVGH